MRTLISILVVIGCLATIALAEPLDPTTRARANTETLQQTSEMTHLTEQKRNDKLETNHAHSINNTQEKKPLSERPMHEEGDSKNSWIDTANKMATLVATILGWVATILGWVTTILGCIVTYKGLQKVPAMKDNAWVIGLAVVAVAFVFSSMLSGIFSSLVYVLIAIIILFIVVVLASVYLLKVINEKYPDIIDKLILPFIESNHQISNRELVGTNMQTIEYLLANIILVIGLSGKSELELDGSFVPGYSKSKFTIFPDVNDSSHWKNLEDQILIPVNTQLKAIKAIEAGPSESPTTEIEVVNIQPGILVIKEGEDIKYEPFNYDGYKNLIVNYMTWRKAELTSIQVQQQKLKFPS